MRNNPRRIARSILETMLRALETETLDQNFALHHREFLVLGSWFASPNITFEQRDDTRTTNYKQTKRLNDKLPKKGGGEGRRTTQGKPREKTIISNISQSESDVSHTTCGKHWNRIELVTIGGNVALLSGMRHKVIATDTNIWYRNLEYAGNAGKTCLEANVPLRKTTAIRRTGCINTL